MATLQKKICMLGAFGVGKTSLVKRYVHSLFAEKYLSTVGVKIDKKALSVGGRDVALMLWDLYGEDAFQKVQQSYLRGSAGFLLVVDGTRLTSLTIADELGRLAHDIAGPVPQILVLNKCDLRMQWELQKSHLDALQSRGSSVIFASAKTGEGVDAAFSLLAEKLLKAAVP